MWAYLLSDSENSCFAVLVIPYPVSGPAYLPRIPNLLHCMSKRCTRGASDCLSGGNYVNFQYKIIYFVHMRLMHCIYAYILFVQPLFVTHVLVWKDL